MTTNVPVRDVREANPVNVTSSPSGRFITSRNEFACELVPVLASAEHGCAVGTKFYTFRWILNHIKIAMGYCSSKINYLGARYPSTSVQLWRDGLHFTSKAKSFRIDSKWKKIFFLFHFPLFPNLLQQPFFPNFVGNIITYLK